MIFAANYQLRKMLKNCIPNPNVQLKSHILWSGLNSLCLVLLGRWPTPPPISGQLILKSGSSFLPRWWRQAKSVTRDRCSIKGKKWPKTLVPADGIQEHAAVSLCFWCFISIHLFSFINKQGKNSTTWYKRSLILPLKTRLTWDALLSKFDALWNPSAEIPSLLTKLVTTANMSKLLCPASGGWYNTVWKANESK